MSRLYARNYTDGFGGIGSRAEYYDDSEALALVKQTDSQEHTSFSVDGNVISEGLAAEILRSLGRSDPPRSTPQSPPQFLQKREDSNTLPPVPLAPVPPADPPQTRVFDPMTASPAQRRPFEGKGGVLPARPFDPVCGSPYRKPLPPVPEPAPVSFARGQGRGYVGLFKEKK